MVEALRQKTGGYGFDGYLFPFISVALRSTQAVTYMNTKKLPWGKMWPARRAQSSAVLAVLNVKLRVEDKHSIFPLGLRGLLRQSFICTNKS